MTVKLDVTEFVRDFSRGLRDRELLEKHGLNVRQMVRVVQKLMNDGVITREHYDSRNRKIGEIETRQERDFIKSLHHCPVCGHIHPTPFNSCPACGAEVTSFTSGGPSADAVEARSAPEPHKESPAPSRSRTLEAVKESLWEPPDAWVEGEASVPRVGAAEELLKSEAPAGLPMEEPSPPADDEPEGIAEIEPTTVEAPEPTTLEAPEPTILEAPKPAIVEAPEPEPVTESVSPEARPREIPERLKELVGQELEDISIFVSLPGRRYEGEYKIAEALACGSKCGVFKAEPSDGESLPIAVRVLEPGVVEEEDEDEVLDRIIEVQSGMVDDNVVALLGSATLAGKRALLYEYLPTTAQSLLEREPDGLPVDEMLQILPQILNGVGYAHLHRGEDQVVRRVPHLDLKVSKLLLDPERKIVKICGFGIITALTGVRKKRSFLHEEPGVDPGLVAPECFVHAVRFVNRMQVDIYALGGVLYRLITGKTHFSCADLEEYKFAHMKRYPIPPRVHRYDIPLWLDAMILQCLHKDPEERWRSATQMELAIKA
jgi:hypothetical protein